jgi:hypothetical protein
MSNQTFNYQNRCIIERSAHDAENPFVQIRREIFEDLEISAKAKGLLGYILTRPDKKGWTICHCQLQKAMNMGEDALNSALNELIKAGYARRSRQRFNGQFQPYKYEISELKKFLPNRKNPPGESSQCKSPPHHVFNQTGKTGPENPDIINNDLQNKDCYVKNNVPPSPQNRSRKSQKKDIDETLFHKHKNSGQCFKSQNTNVIYRYKLTPEQIEIFNHLKSLKINTNDDTLCWWAKNYSLERIMEVYHASKKETTRDLAAYMQQLFKLNACVANAHSIINKEFAKDFKKAIGWHDLNIGELYVSFHVGNDTQDLSLNMEPTQFAEILMQKHANLNRE